VAHHAQGALEGAISGQIFVTNLYAALNHYNKRQVTKMPKVSPVLSIDQMSDSMTKAAADAV
jgi:hypothetical protein